MGSTDWWSGMPTYNDIINQVQTALNTAGLTYVGPAPVPVTSPPAPQVDQTGKLTSNPLGTSGGLAGTSNQAGSNAPAATTPNTIPVSPVNPSGNAQTTVQNTTKVAPSGNVQSSTNYTPYLILGALVVGVIIVGKYI